MPGGSTTVRGHSGPTVAERGCERQDSGRAVTSQDPGDPVRNAALRPGDGNCPGRTGPRRARARDGPRPAPSRPARCRASHVRAGRSRMRAMPPHSDPRRRRTPRRCVRPRPGSPRRRDSRHWPRRSRGTRTASTSRATMSCHSGRRISGSSAGSFLSTHPAMSHYAPPVSGRGCREAPRDEHRTVARPRRRALSTLR